MKRSLRRTHLGAWLCMLVLLPLGLAAALRARPEQPAAPLPDASGTRAGPLVGGEQPKAQRVGRIEELQLAWSLPMGPSGERRELCLYPEAALSQPDVLVYWNAASRAAASPDALPEGVQLIGSYHDSAGGAGRASYLLPPAAFAGAGEVILYSLAHQRRLGSIPLPELED